MMEMEMETQSQSQSQSFAVKWNHVYPQLVIDTIMSLTSICGGLSNSFVNLLGEDVVDVETKSWLASVTSLMTILGTLAVGPLVDKLGRRPTLLTIDAICILSWALIWAAAGAGHNASPLPLPQPQPSFLLLIGVPLTGLVRGGIGALNVIFVTEITHKKYRSTMLSFTLVYLTFGILAVGLLGTFVTWKTVALLCLLFFGVVFALAVRYTVESPIWLVNFKGDSCAAKRCLKKLIPDTRLFEREWMEMESAEGGVDDDDDEKACRRKKRSNVGVIRGLTEASFYRPAGVLTVLLTLSQISGVNYMIYFAVEAIGRVGHDLGLAYAKQIFAVVAGCKFALSLFATALSTKFRRKTLLYASAWATLASSLSIALCSWLRSYATSTWPEATTLRSASDYVAVTAYVIYMSCGAFGIWLVPYTLIGELLPNRLRGSCAPLFVCFSYAVMSAGAKLFPRLLATLTVAHIFLFYALVSALILIFVAFYVPETGDKSLKQIENYFSRQLG